MTVIIFFTFSTAALACIEAPSIAGGTITFPEVSDMAKLQPIKLYPTRNFSGQPVLELNQQGMFYKGEIICIWGNMKDCDPNLPISIKEGFSDSNIVLRFDDKEYYLRITSYKDDQAFKAEANIFTTIYKGQRLYYDIETFHIDIMSGGSNQKC